MSKAVEGRETIVESQLKRELVVALPRACPLCEPARWDASRAVVPSIAICPEHIGHPAAVHILESDAQRQADFISRLRGRTSEVRDAHNVKQVGSTPAPATNFITQTQSNRVATSEPGESRTGARVPLLAPPEEAKSHTGGITICRDSQEVVPPLTAVEHNRFPEGRWS